MKLAILSDLHFEHYKDLGSEFIESMDGKADVLILAGDILTSNNYNTLLIQYQKICAKYKNVIFVKGNHEFYGDSVYHKENQFAKLNKEITNLHILDDAEHIVLDGQRFIGGTMWFANNPNNVHYKRGMNDFFCIDKFEPWVYEKNQIFELGLTNKLNTDDIVITHHLPSEKSIANQFKDSKLNCFFLNDMEYLIEERQPRLWIHGHTHTASDYLIDNTRVICNAHGYPGEKKTDFNPKLTIDI